MTCLEDGKCHFLKSIFCLDEILDFQHLLIQFHLYNESLGWINLPEPVKNFHATFIQDTKIALAWDPIISKCKYMNTLFYNHDNEKIYLDNLLLNSYVY